MPVKAFDKQPGAGWRVIGERGGCEAEAADLIADYRARHAQSLVEAPLDQLRGLLRHESQLRAAAGQIDRAVRLRQNAREDADPAQQLYDDATIAFWQRDLAKLEAARRDLAALPRPPWFEEAAARAKQRYDLSVAWPPNLDVVDALIRCFGRPYAEAYGDACRHTEK